MSEIIFRGTTVERGKSVGNGFTIAIGIALAIYTLLGLVIGEKAPNGMPESLPYTGTGGLILLVYGIWKYHRIRGDLFVTRGKNNAMGITLMGAGRKKILEFYSPFEARTGFEIVNLGKGKRIYFLYMVFRDKSGNVALSLESQRNAFLGAPDGWKQKSRDEMGEMPNCYMCSHMSELSKAIRSHLK
jgi:hypothetical protein